MSDPSPCVLLIEDDPALGDRVRALLGAEGYSVVLWRKGRTLTADDVRAVDLVLLDLMLPEVHGLDVLRVLRSGGHRDLPVIVLSARDDTESKVRALRGGADDYLTKPFWPEELVERVRARLRRPTVHADAAIVVGALTIDPATRVVQRNGRAIELTRTELELLLLLARRMGRAVSRKELAQRALDPERESGARALDVHVSNLRKKLDGACTIETVWGIGYRLRAQGGDGESA